MCGIAGTIFRKNYNKGIVIKKEELGNILNEIKLGNSKVNLLLEKSWKYKSNVNFLRYCRTKEERDYIEIFCNDLKKLSENYLKELEKVDKKKSPQLIVDRYAEYEKLLDVEWFLSHEVSYWNEKIIELSASKPLQLPDSALIFYKSLVSVINSIDNRMEIRGRDSFGICISLFSENLNIKVENWLSADGSECVYFERFPDYQVVSFVFKTANRIGSLGDNCKNIVEKIKHCGLLKKIICEERAECGTIVAHTRWASVGEVNISNCHPISNSGKLLKLRRPIVFTSLNGDIHNYKELISNSSFDKNELDENCTTDCLAIPITFSDIDIKSVKAQKKIFNQFHGSFAIALQSSKNPGCIILGNKGSQGLYIGVSYDNIMFASDVYGLVETCKYFRSIKSGSLISISDKSKVYSEDFIFKINKFESEEEIDINNKDLSTTNITTRDIDRKGYDHFLFKEIIETKDIVQKTILGYLQAPELIDQKDFHNAIVCDENQVPRHVVKNLENGKIKEIIITGMGTCYTASVAIAGYMRKMLRKYLPGIKVEPHVASEGSAFYLKPNMNDTLVIVIAQSGTTVDTNVYVQMAKERGASSLAIANKREGDVTFIVDGTLYIGSGRDIEIAVPSTKTYTAQVILGYILTLYFCCMLNRKNNIGKLLENNIELLREAPKLIDESFKSLDNIDNFNCLYEYPLKYNSWYLAYDDSPNSVCAMEIRIKYSEGCYQSLPYIHIEELARIGVTDSFVTYISNKELDELKSVLMKLVNNNNRIVLLAQFDEIDDDLTKLQNEKKIKLIKIPEVKPTYSFIPTIIAGQLLSYYAAVCLDSRKEYIGNLIDSIKKSRNVDKEWINLESAIKEGLFNQGYSLIQIEHLKELYKKYNANQNDSSVKENLLSFLEELYQFARRPIDTIKHQAKTLTVGAVRQDHYSSFGESFSVGQLSNKDGSSAVSLDSELIENEIKFLSTMLDNLESFDISKNDFSNTLIYPYGIDECYGYFVTGYLNDFSLRSSIRCNFSLARDYDMFEQLLDDDSMWIIICDSSERDVGLLDKYLKNKKHIIFDFSVKNNNIMKSLRYLPKINNRSIRYSLGCLCLSILLSINLVRNNKEIYAKEMYFLEKNVTDLVNSWRYVFESNQMLKELKSAVSYLLMKRNWKCLGSGVNYNSAKYAAKNLILNINRSCAFDVLENHKHIDISAESACIIFIANIWRQSYQNDVMSEVDKLVSHENIPIIITNFDDNRFDDINMKVNIGNGKIEIISLPIIRLPYIHESVAFPINVFLVERLVDSLKNSINENSKELKSKVAITSPSEAFIR